MKLYELAYACRLYHEVAQFDPSYQRMCDALGHNPDLASQAEQDALMQFLDDWRWRIPKKNFLSLKERLQHWRRVWIPQLPENGRDIHSLNDDERAQVGVSYEELLRLGAGLHFQITSPPNAPETNPIERVWWRLYEQITRCHRCQTMEQLLNLIFAWLHQRTRFTVEDAVYALPPAA